MQLEELSQQIRTLNDSLLRSHPPEVMTTKEAAAFLGVSELTVFNWRKDGIGPRYSQPQPRIVRYLKEDLVAWLREEQ